MIDIWNTYEEERISRVAEAWEGGGLFWRWDRGIAWCWFRMCDVYRQ